MRNKISRSRQRENEYYSFNSQKPRDSRIMYNIYEWNRNNKDDAETGVLTGYWCIVEELETHQNYDILTTKAYSYYTNTLTRKTTIIRSCSYESLSEGEFTVILGFSNIKNIKLWKNFFNLNNLFTIFTYSIETYSQETGKNDVLKRKCAIYLYQC